MSRLIGRRAAAEVLERRYRRLLACYPAAYRAANAEEMLGVALARSPAGRRRPELGEAISLIASGIGKRAGGIRSGYRDPAWQEAGAVLTIIGSIALATSSAYDVIGGMFGWGALPVTTLHPAKSALTSAAGWTMVAGAAICGRRWGRRWREVAAAGACLGAVGQAIVLASDYSGNPSELVTSWWRLVLAVVIASSAVIAVGGEGRPLSWRPITAIMLAGAAIAAYPAMEAATVTVTSYPDGSGTSSSPLFGVSGLVRYGLITGFGIVTLVAIGRCRPEVRRRVVILLMPVAAAMALVAGTFGGFLASSPRFMNPVLLTPPQWAALVFVPATAFAVGLWWLRRYERYLGSFV